MSKLGYAALPQSTSPSTRSLCTPWSTKALLPESLQKSEEQNGTGRYWTDYENHRWKPGSDGFETVVDRMMEKLGLEGDEEISYGEAYGNMEVDANEIGSKNMSKEKWKKRIQNTTIGGDYDLAFKFGSKQQDGKTGAGWTVRNQYYGGRGLGDIATVFFFFF